jgi:acetyl-CoA carboxylase biotin carboxylase subunit
VPAGPGIRDDSGVTLGSVISVHYDPMISKLCAFGATRAEAIERMRRALAEYHVGGIRTNLAFHRRVLRHPAFIAGDYDTGFIERYKADLAPPALDAESVDLAAIGAALAARAAPPAPSAELDTSAVEPSEWRRSIGPLGR